MIGDKKTPPEARQFCERLTSIYRIPIQYMEIEEQEQVLEDYPKLKQIVPHNSACRKILGMLIAYLEGFENLITVDDDNFVGTLKNIADEIEFSPSDIKRDRVIFDIRILKNSDVGLGLLFAISFLWLTELIPLAASSLIIPVVIVLSGIILSFLYK